MVMCCFFSMGERVIVYAHGVLPSNSSVFHTEVLCVCVVGGGDP